MPTPSQVNNRAQPVAGDTHYPATVTIVGNPATVTLDPGGATTTARVVNAQTLTVGDRVLVLVTAAGNYVLGRI